MYTILVSHTKIYVMNKLKAVFQCKFFLNAKKKNEICNESAGAIKAS